MFARPFLLVGHISMDTKNRSLVAGYGRSIDDIVAAKPTAAFDAKWWQFVITPAFFTRLVYQGVLAAMSMAGRKRCQCRAPAAA